MRKGGSKEESIYETYLAAAEMHAGAAYAHQSLG